MSVDCKYLLFLKDFFFELKPKQYEKCQYIGLFKKNIWTLIKQNESNVELFDKKQSENQLTYQKDLTKTIDANFF